MSKKEIKIQEITTPQLPADEWEEQFPDFHPRQLSVVPVDLDQILADAE